MCDGGMASRSDAHLLKIPGHFDHHRLTCMDPTRKRSLASLIDENGVAHYRSAPQGVNSKRRR